MDRARIDTPKTAAEVVEAWEATAIDAHAAAWAFASHHHGGQWSPLYRVLCASKFEPGPLMSAERIENDDDGEWTAAYAIYHEAAAHRTEQAQADFLNECIRIADFMDESEDE